MLGKQLGKRAMLIGALAQSIPDIDFVTSFIMPLPQSLLAHRGFTHSILFAVLITFFLSLLLRSMHKEKNLALKYWFLLIGVEVSIHLFIDTFNVYGTGLFEPFSHARISFNTLYVADPFFSIWTAIATVALLVIRTTNKKRVIWARISIIITAVYLMYCTFNKVQIDKQAKNIFTQQHINFTDYFTTPTPLNNWLWYIAANTDSGCYIGYRSVFDRNKNTELHYFSRNEFLLDSAENKEDINYLKKFSKGFYTAQKSGDTLIFNDARFEQIVGWYDPEERFAFHYFLNKGSNDLVIQRGRFAKWNKFTFKALLHKISGQ